MDLNVLLVEDDEQFLEQFKRDLPDLFVRRDISVNIDGKSTFEDGLEAIRNPHIRYDLIISDTYRGAQKNHDTAVLEMVHEYKNGKFTPIVVFSSGQCPSDLEISAFVSWADKGKDLDVERAINEILDIGLPQLARTLHDDLDKAAGSFLWDFLEKNWDELKPNIDKEQLERIIRRRAALTISDLMPGSDTHMAVPNRYGLEYYIYPSLDHNYYNLGDIIRNKNTPTDFRVILTPHCYLFTQPGQERPRADHVLTVKTITAENVLGDKINNAKQDKQDKQHKKLKKWAKSPAQTDRHPEGRHWYLPKFLEIPHLFCDFLQLESIEYASLIENYDSLATLTPPYAEALQECFSSFYGSVGIPEIAPESIRDLLE